MLEQKTDEFYCDSCGDLLDPQRDIRYRCTKCPEIDVCKDCYVSGEFSHPHKLVSVRPKLKAKLLFNLEDPKKKRRKGTLYLSNYPVALPASPYLKKLDIRGVLSVIQFDDKDDTSKMLMLFNGGKPLAEGSTLKKSTLVINKVLYHHIDIPDLQGPDLLAQYNEFLFEEATVFLDEILKVGNALVHCKEGQKRSPTIFLAWMITRGYSVEDAISAIGEGYQDPDFDWREKYEKTRSGWITKLHQWAKTWERDQKDWRKDNADKIERWRQLIHQGVLGNGAAGRKIVANQPTQALREKQQQQQPASEDEEDEEEEEEEDDNEEERKQVTAVRRGVKQSTLLSHSPARSLQEKRQALAQRQRVAVQKSDEEEDQQQQPSGKKRKREAEQELLSDPKANEAEGEEDKENHATVPAQTLTKKEEEENKEPKKKIQRLATLSDANKAAKGNTLLQYFSANKAK